MQLLRLLENIDKIKPGSKWMLTKTMSVTYDGDHPDYPVMSSVSPIEDFDIGQILVDKIDDEGNVHFKFVGAEGPDSVMMRTHKSTFVDCAVPLREYNKKFLQGLVDPDLNESINDGKPTDYSELTVGSKWFIIGDIFAFCRNTDNFRTAPRGRAVITKVDDRNGYVLFSINNQEYSAKNYRFFNNISKKPQARDVKFLNSLLHKDD